jgi:hypothetical protein
MNRGEHWNRIFTTKTDQDVSWFEALPALSVEMIEACGLTADTCVIDVGGGDSRLIDKLAADGLTCLAVLDVSGAALARSRSRIGQVGDFVTWIESDVVGDWSLKPMDVWHDRAVFHFLVDVDDRRRYRAHLGDTLKHGGSAVIATFALNGPEKCSGLPVARYSPTSLARELGNEFELVDSRAHEHHTPWGSVQSFQYSRFRRH